MTLTDEWLMLRYGHRINELLHDWILRHIDGPPPPIPTTAISPWESLFGDYEKSSDEESD